MVSEAGCQVPRGPEMRCRAWVISNLSMHTPRDQGQAGLTCDLQVNTTPAPSLILDLRGACQFIPRQRDLGGSRRF